MKIKDRIPGGEDRKDLSAEDNALEQADELEHTSKVEGEGQGTIHMRQERLLLLQTIEMIKMKELTEPHKFASLLKSR